MNWNDIKIKHYAEIIKLNEDSFEDQIKAIGVINGKTIEETRALPLTELSKLIEEFKSLELKEIPKKPKSKWDGYKISHKMKDIDAGQMIDYDTLREMGNEVQNLHKFMAILTSPKNEEEYEKRAEHFWNNMPIGVAYGTHVFFCKLHKQLGISMNHYSKEMENRMHSVNTTAGKRFCTYFRTATQSLKKKWYR